MLYLSVVVQFTSSGWIQIGGPAAMIYAGGDGLFATDPATGNVNRYNGNGWVNVGGPGYTFAATDGNLLGLSPNQDTVFEWSGSGTAWFQIGGSADYLTAGS